jgi:hypothetical protein
MVDILVSFKPYPTVNFEVKIVYGLVQVPKGNIYRIPYRYGTYI